MFFVLIFCGCSFLQGQNKQLLYDFTEIPQALLINPGMETSYSWYAGIPLLSGTSFQAGLSGISIDAVFANDGVDINQKVRERAVFGMGTRDELSGTFQIDILNGGFRGKRNKDNFYSFGVYLEGDAIGYWPRDYAILAFEGNADRLGRRFMLDHLKTRGELVNVFHFGINKRVDKRLILGARGKIYSSIFNFNSTRNKGYFVTTEGQNNLLANTLVADMELRTSGLDEIREVLQDGAVDDFSGISDIFKRRALLGGNLGLGIDLGFTYNINEKTVFTGSILDIGFIYHTKDIRNYTLKGSATVEGIEVILPDSLADPNKDFWQDLVDEVEGLVPFDENSNKYITFRPTKLNASVRYNFGEQLQRKGDCNCSYKVSADRKGTRYVNGLGGQLYMINRPRGPQAALTAFYQRRLGNVLAVKTTYTVDKFSYSNLGLGFNLQLGKFNMYGMADNLLAYRNLADAHYVSFQFGFNILSW